jgi:hypothetical protein
VPVCSLQILSSPFVVAPAAAYEVVVRQQPGAAMGGTLFQPQPVLALVDAFGNVVPSASGGTGATATVAVVAGPGGWTAADLKGVGTATFSAGLAHFSGLYIDRWGFAVCACVRGIPARYPCVVSLRGIPAWRCLPPRPPPSQPCAMGVLLRGPLLLRKFTPPVSAVSAPAHCRAALCRAGLGYQLRFTTTVTVASPRHIVDSEQFTVAVGPTVRLVVATQPAGALGGAPFATQPVVELHDAGGNVNTADVTSLVTASIAINPSRAVLYPQYHRFQVPTIRASIATGDVWVTLSPALPNGQTYLIHGDLVELGPVNEVGPDASPPCTHTPHTPHAHAHTRTPHAHTHSRAYTYSCAHAHSS